MLLIYAKLAVSAGDREWIDTVRRSHDPQHRLIQPHFTFVFPFDDVPVDAVLAHAGAVAAATAMLDFRLSEAVAVKDALSPVSHVFLVPSDGAEQMRALHDRLYSGPLEARLDQTIPFLPHVTVGAFDEAKDAKHMAASLGPIDISGRLEAICISAFDGQAVTELHELRFAGGR